MRLLRLYVRNYGHFENREFDLSAPGLQVLHGPNEAGKSTLLNFVRELLFGFAERTPYAFRGEKPNGAADLLLTSGREFRFERYKGRPDKLTLHADGVPRSMAREEWQQTLGGANSELFQRIFAFGLQELAAGQESLKEKSVETALFGTAVEGRASPVKLLATLQESADEIFTPSGRTKAVNKVLSEISELQKQMKLATLKSDTWADHQRKLEESQQRASQLEEQLRQVRREQTHSERLLQARPVGDELAVLREQLLQAGPIPSITAAQTSDFRKVRLELTRDRQQQAQLQADLAAIQQRIASSPDRSAWVAQRHAIEHVRGQIQSAADARRDLPDLRREVEQIQSRLDTEIRLLIPDWQSKNWHSFSLTAEQSDAGRRLRLEAQDRTDALRQTTTRLAELQQELARCQGELQQQREFPEIAARQRVLAEQPAAVARLKDLARLTKELATQDRKVTKLRKKLAPYWPEERALEGPVADLPRAEEISELHQRWQTQERRVEDAKRMLVTEQERSLQLEQELQRLQAHTGKLPTTEDLHTLRQQRSALWLSLQQILAGAPFDTLEFPEATQHMGLGSVDQLATAYQSLVQQTDEVADLLFANSAAVEKHSQCEQQSRTVSTRAEHWTRECDAMTELQHKWQTRWQRVDIRPGTPTVMLAWLTDWEAWQTERESQTEQQALYQGLVDEQQQFTARMQTLLPELPIEREDDPTGHFEVLRTQVDEIREALMQREATTRQLAQHRERQQVLEQQLQAQTDSERDWLERWSLWLQSLSLPTGWLPDLAHEVLQQVKELQQAAARIPEYEHRIQLMESRLAEFDPQVRSLCEVLAIEAGESSPEAAARQLADELQRALRDDQQQHHDRERAREVQEQLAALQRGLAEQELCLANLRQAADVSDDDAFLQAAERAQLISELRTKFADKEQEFARLRGTLTVAEVQACDPVELEVAVGELKRQVDTVTSELQAANQEVGACRTVLNACDGSGVAAELQGQISQQRAGLAELVERYIPLCLARELLQQSLRRFEEQSQPELLQETSRIFAELTAGRYVRVERPLHSDRALLVHRTDHEPLSPDALSTGTREQLYLALRLAYMRHYCQQAEPLPIVLDDVFANFDPGRTRLTLQALQQLAQHTQVLLFTCHPEIVELAREVAPTGWQPIAIPTSA